MFTIAVLLAIGYRIPRSRIAADPTQEGWVKYDESGNVSAIGEQGEYVQE